MSSNKSQILKSLNDSSYCFMEGKAGSSLAPDFAGKSPSTFSIDPSRLLAWELAIKEGPSAIDLKGDLEVLAWKSILTERDIRKLHLLRQMKRCAEGHWKPLICEECGEIVEEKAVKESCHKRICKNPDCVKARYTKAKNKLKAYLRHVSRVKEFVISFAWVQHYSKRRKKKAERVLNHFFHLLRKRGFDIQAIKTFDILRKKGDRWFLHFHYIALPYASVCFDLRVWHRIQQKTEKKHNIKFHISIGKYKQKRRAISYMANRIAGYYGHKKDRNAFFLADAISLDEYLDDFHRYRGYAKIGRRSSKQAPWPCEMCYNHAYFLWLSSILSSSLPHKCPVCGSEKLKVWSSGSNDLNRGKPPPDPSKISSYCSTPVN